MAYTAIIRSAEILSALCKGQGKWGMYINACVHSTIPDENWTDEVTKAAPWLSLEDLDELVFNERAGFFLFDSLRNMQEAFDETVGDDGPTRLNSYDGPVTVYALTCSPTGELTNENT